MIIAGDYYFHFGVRPMLDDDEDEEEAEHNLFMSYLECCCCYLCVLIIYRKFPIMRCANEITSESFCFLFLFFWGRYFLADRSPHLLQCAPMH